MKSSNSEFRFVTSYFNIYNLVKPTECLKGEKNEVKTLNVFTWKAVFNWRGIQKSISLKL